MAMAEVTFDVTPATPQKRSHDEITGINNDSATNSTVKSSLIEPGSVSRRGSPAPSTASSLTELSSTHEILSSSNLQSSTTGPPAKKRKLTFLEKEVEKATKQKDKEEKARLKAEEKQRKEEEKARKDEEKRRLAEEKEAAKRIKEVERAEKQAAIDEKKKLKDAEKAAKDAKKVQDEQEKLKKERSQMRLAAFFGKPKPEATPPSTPEDVSEGAASRRSSIAIIDMEQPLLDTPTTASLGPANPEYERWIFPFFVADHTDLAPYNRFKLSRQTDFEIAPAKEQVSLAIGKHTGQPRRRLRKTKPVKDLVQNIQASGLDILDLDARNIDALQDTPYKHLQFHEDVRPPYQGTYTRAVSPRTARKLSRRPFSRNLPDTNYDYDSEAEWEPPGEDDEDLGDDDEMSEADDGEEEMADFLDDANDTARKKGPVIAMEPISSGLCWTDEAYNDNGLNIKQYQMNLLHDSTNLPIDPYSSWHWSDELKPKSTAKLENSLSMQPPAARLPLSALSPNAGVSVKQETGIDGRPLPKSSQKPAATGKVSKLIDAEYLDDFKKAVEGSDLTKTGLIEVLKKQFPKASKDAIKGTLETVATRVGKKEVEKKWVLVTS